LKMQMIQFVSISKRIQMKLIYIVRIESEWELQVIEESKLDVWQSQRVGN
jgi:hypothetical protein